MPDLRRSAGKTLLPRKRQCAVRFALGAKDCRQCGDREGKEEGDSNQAARRVRKYISLAGEGEFPVLKNYPDATGWAKSPLRSWSASQVPAVGIGCVIAC